MLTTRLSAIAKAIKSNDKTISISSISSRAQSTMSCPSLTPPIPVALIGIHTEIARPVAEGLKPDWEIIRFIQSVEAAKQDLPYLLHGQEPPNPPTNDIGTSSFPPSSSSFSFSSSSSSSSSHTPTPHSPTISPPTSPSTTTSTSTSTTTRPIRAILFGRGFSQAQAESLYSLFQPTALEPVLWVAGAAANLPHGRPLPDGFAPPKGVEKIVVPAFLKELEKWRADGAKEGKIVFY
ncbi:hypothetical protein GGR50DRAFT_643371 [Xylaria sp. CBS 124048]|nr:hypothetical protein GGR50DRAFT_643371 [Xylaria sp. CBS 124048]